VASRQSAADTMKKADAAFKNTARPASFERGQQALADADKALAEADLDAAKPFLVTAAAEFAAARGEADQLNALADAQSAWSALAAADEDLLNRQVGPDFQRAKTQATAAQNRAASGQPGVGREAGAAGIRSELGSGKIASKVSGGAT